MHQIGKLKLSALVLPGLLAWPLAAHANEIHGIARGSAPVLIAQSASPASIFSPWSNSDVRMGAGMQAAPTPPATGGVKPDAFPKDVRRTSEPSKDAIPIFHRSGRDELEDIRTGSRSESERAGAGRSMSREPLITLQPFSDGDVRQGSRGQQRAAPQPATDTPKSVTVPAETKGLFGRVLERIGF